MRARIGATSLLASASTVLLAIASCADTPLDCPVEYEDWVDHYLEFKEGCTVDSDCVVVGQREPLPMCVCPGAYLKDRVEELKEVYSCLRCGGLSVSCEPVQTPMCVEGRCVSR